MQVNIYHRLCVFFVPVVKSLQSRILLFAQKNTITSMIHLQGYLLHIVEKFNFQFMKHAIFQYFCEITRLMVNDLFLVKFETDIFNSFKVSRHV